MKYATFAMPSLALGLVSFTSPALAQTGTVTVNATDSVYNSDSPGAAGGGSTQPTGINVSGLSYLTFTAGGMVTVNGGGNYNDPDGVGSASPETNTGTSSLSGISAPTAGYIAGVFLNASSASMSAPAATDFTGPNGTAFTSLSPLLNQVFFLGDGHTGDGTGSEQMFYVPTGATELYFGLADACGYYGGPSCLGDNSGSFNLSYTAVGGVTPPPPPPPAQTPEPSSLILLGTGALGLANTARRRFLR